jgi:glycine oxidase
VAIAGGGIIGLSLAWRLAQRGFRVVVFDKGTLGGEASWAGAGMLAPGGEIDAPSPWATLALESRQLYPSFVRELESASGLAIDFQECGGLDLAYDVAERDLLAARAAIQRDLGIASKALELAKIPAFWPRVRTAGLLGARFCPDDAIVNPRDVILGLVTVCRNLGVAMKQNCPVEEIHLSGDVAWVTAGGTSAEYQALVIAAGAWSSTIRSSTLLPEAEPVKGHLAGYQQPQQTCPTIVRHAHTYLLQRANGLLIAGSSVRRAGFEREIEPAVVSNLSARATFILPHLGDTSPSEVWTGFRPASASLRMGRWHSDGLYLAYGHYRNGILLAPVTAQKLAAEISANLEKR